MADLFSHLPDDEEIVCNYATQKALQWIAGDLDLEDRCREIVMSARHDADAATLVQELRTFVVSAALVAETDGFFFDLFTQSVREIQWPNLAIILREDAIDY